MRCKSNIVSGEIPAVLLFLLTNLKLRVVIIQNNLIFRFLKVTFSMRLGWLEFLSYFYFSEAKL